MKINSGLINISNNINAWQRFVLATPEMLRLSTEFKGQFGVTAHRPQEHHDTLTICLAAAASQRCPEARMVLFSPDTDVLVLAVAHYDKLCRNTAILMVSGILEIGPIWRALGRERQQHYMYSTHSQVQTMMGDFLDLAKQSFQQYMKVDREVISALIKLTEEGDVTQDVKDALAKFVCLMYCPKGIHISCIPDLRWHLFCKHLAENTKLPPTAGSLEQHIERVHVQARVWSQANRCVSIYLDPLKHGYYQDDHDNILPTTSKVPPVPQAILELIKCRVDTLP